MVPFQIKICGVKTFEDARHACQSGADAIGLNFYKKSSRYVSQEAATEIVNQIRATDLANPVLVVGVFVNEPVESVTRIATEVGLGCIQLHGDEPVSDVAEIRETIGRKESIKVIRAIRTQPSTNSESEESVGECTADAKLELEMARIQKEIEGWVSVGVDAVLLDAAVDGEFGGTGKSVDWSAVSRLKSNVAIVLAGGLTADNVSDAIRISKAKSVDVASGVESAPGVKDDELVSQFIRAAKSELF